MAIIRWEPFGSMDDAFNRVFARRQWAFDNDVEGKRSFLPSADISETDKEYLIRTELPAVRKEDVHVTTEDGMITIQGERKHLDEEKNERFHRVESSYGTFTRSFALPENADAEAIRCQSRDGVLTVHIPKKSEKKAKARRIDVQ
jgi:HSP20 family protein